MAAKNVAKDLFESLGVKTIREKSLTCFVTNVCKIYFFIFENFDFLSTLLFKIKSDTHVYVIHGTFYTEKTTNTTGGKTYGCKIMCNSIITGHPIVRI